MSQNITLEPIEEMALLGAMLVFVPYLDPNKAKIREHELEVGREILLRALEHDDGDLNRIEVRENLEEDGLKKVIDRFGRVRAAVCAILANRRGRLAGMDARHHLLTAIIDGAADAARRANIPERAESVRLAAYCAAIVHGPDRFLLPINAPVGVTRPLGYVPSVTELQPGEDR